MENMDRMFLLFFILLTSFVGFGQLFISPIHTRRVHYFRSVWEVKNASFCEKTIFNLAANHNHSGFQSTRRCSQLRSA